MNRPAPITLVFALYPYTETGEGRFTNRPYEILTEPDIRHVYRERVLETAKYEPERRRRREEHWWSGNEADTQVRAGAHRNAALADDR